MARVAVGRVLEGSREPLATVGPTRSIRATTKVDDGVRDPGDDGSLLFGEGTEAGRAVVWKTMTTESKVSELRKRRGVSSNEELISLSQLAQIICQGGRKGNVKSVLEEMRKESETEDPHLPATVCVGQGRELAVREHMVSRVSCSVLRDGKSEARIGRIGQGRGRGRRKPHARRRKENPRKTKFRELPVQRIARSGTQSHSQDIAK